MIAAFFAHLYLQFRQVANWFDSIADWLLAQGWPWYYLAPPFQGLHDVCMTIADFFYDIYIGAHNLETKLDDAWSKAKQAFNYAYDVLTDKVNDALNAAQDAWNYAYDVLRRRVNDALDAADDAWDFAYTAYRKARDAWNYATGWLTDRANEAYNKAVWAYEQIAAAVTAASQDIYAWVKGIPAEISDFVNGVVATLKTWAAGAIGDSETGILSTIAAPINLVNLWFDDIQGFFNSPLDWLESKFADWFFGPEK